MASVEAPTWVLGARSETGYVRACNEDRMGWTRTAYGNIYVVADGMGGYRGGALAAELTVHTLQDRLAALFPGDAAFPEQVRQAFLTANQAVYTRRRADDPDTRDMGATGVALITWGPRILVGHVGDSRAYLWQKEGGLKRLTRDHTPLGKKVDGASAAAADLDAGILDRAIGHLPTVEADVSAWITLTAGDMALLCSDGLCGYVDDAEINEVLGSKIDPQALTDKLVDCALSKGGEDNVTVQLVRFSDVSSRSNGVVGRLLQSLKSRSQSSGIG
jgi:serine/threonine protein phosphatase PrpC